MVSYRGTNIPPPPPKYHEAIYMYISAQYMYPAPQINMNPYLLYAHMLLTSKHTHDCCACSGYMHVYADMHNYTQCSYYYSIIPAFPLVVAGVRSECQCLHHVTPEMIRTIVVIGICTYHVYNTHVPI